MPHLRVPIQRVTRSNGTRGMATVDQDSDDEVNACIFAVLNTPAGHRIDLPEFGTPGQAHRRGGANLAQLEHVVALWEPRADIIALRETGELQRMALEAGIDTVRITGV